MYYCRINKIIVFFLLKSNMFIKGILYSSLNQLYRGHWHLPHLTAVINSSDKLGEFSTSMLKGQLFLKFAPINCSCSYLGLLYWQYNSPSSYVPITVVIWAEFYWCMKPLEKTNDLSQVTDKLYYILLYLMNINKDILAFYWLKLYNCIKLPWGNVQVSVRVT